MTSVISCDSLMCEAVEIEKKHTTLFHSSDCLTLTVWHCGLYMQWQLFMFNIKHIKVDSVHVTFYCFTISPLKLKLCNVEEVYKNTTLSSLSPDHNACYSNSLGHNLHGGFYHSHIQIVWMSLKAEALKGWPALLECAHIWPDLDRAICSADTLHKSYALHKKL